MSRRAADRESSFEPIRYLSSETRARSSRFRRSAIPLSTSAPSLICDPGATPSALWLVFATRFRGRSTNTFSRTWYLWVHTPLITSIDAEGAGQMFQVTTLDLAQVPKKESEVDFDETYSSDGLTSPSAANWKPRSWQRRLGNVYTFGPTFRAENSNTSRHLSEFWMVEPEDRLVRSQPPSGHSGGVHQAHLSSVLEHCGEDMAFFDQRIEPGAIEKLEPWSSSEFARITYSEAIDILGKSRRIIRVPRLPGASIFSPSTSVS